jgi:hypothetical protein
MYQYLSLYFIELHLKKNGGFRPLGQTTLKVKWVVQLPHLAYMEVFEPPTRHFGVI